MNEFNPAAIDRYFEDTKQQIQDDLKAALQKGDAKAWKTGLTKWHEHFGTKNNNYIELLGTKDAPIIVDDKNLAGFDFNQVKLDHVNFKGCTFNGNNFINSSLRNCNIDASDLRGIRFTHGVMENVKVTNGTVAELMVTDSILSNVSMETSFLEGKRANYIGQNQSVSCFTVKAHIPKGQLLDIEQGDYLLFKDNKQVYASHINSEDADCVGKGYDPEIAKANTVVGKDCHTYTAEELTSFTDYKIQTPKEQKEEQQAAKRAERAERNNIVDATPSIFSVSFETVPKTKGLTSSNTHAFAPVPVGWWNSPDTDFKKRGLVHLTFNDFNQQIGSERNVQDEPTFDKMSLGAEYSRFVGYKKGGEIPKFKLTAGASASKVEVNNTEMDMTRASATGLGTHFNYTKWMPSANAEVETGIATNKGPIILHLRANVTLPNKKEQVSSYRSDNGYDVTNTTSLTKVAQNFSLTARCNAWDMFSRRDYTRDNSFVMWSPFVSLRYDTPTTMKEGSVLQKNGVTHTENATFTMPKGFSVSVGLYFGL